MDDRVIRRVSQALRGVGRPLPFRRGDFLMKSGEQSDEVLLIESGAVKVVLSAANGSESILGFCGPGELIGELGVLNGRPRSAVIAHLDGTALHVPRVPFLRLVEQDQETLMLVNETLCRWLHNADRRQLAMASLDMPTRVAAQLLAWAKAYGVPAGTGLSVRGLTHRDLAQVVTASEKSVDAALRLLRARTAGDQAMLVPAPRPSFAGEPAQSARLAARRVVLPEFRENYAYTSAHTRCACSRQECGGTRGPDSGAPCVAGRRCDRLSP